MGGRVRPSPPTTQAQILEQFRRVVGQLDKEIGDDPRWKEEPPEYFLHSFRPDGAKLPELLAGIEKSEGVLERMQTVFAHAGPETGHLYFLVSRPKPLTDAELVKKIRAWTGTIAGLLDAAEVVDKAHVPLVHALVNPKLSIEIVDGPPGEGSDHPLLPLIHEGILWYRDRLDYPLFAEILIEPLYAIACRYALVHWILRPSLGPVASSDDDLFAPRAELWLAGADFAFIGTGKDLRIEAWRSTVKPAAPPPVRRR